MVDGAHWAGHKNREAYLLDKVLVLVDGANWAGQKKLYKKSDSSGECSHLWNVFRGSSFIEVAVAVRDSQHL